MPQSHSSIGFGGPPPDLRPARKVPKATYGAYVRPAFVPVRVRTEGRWLLGLLRRWMLGDGSGWLILIELADPRSAEGSNWTWFHFASSGLDPIMVDMNTGEVRLTPPEDRRGPRDRRG